MVSVVNPLLQLEPVASQGVTLGVPSALVCRMLMNSSGSYTNPIDVMFTDGLNGLNWQVQVLPLSLSMSSLPPTLPVLPVLPPLGADAEPQAAASTPATTIRVIGLRRRIDRPPGFLFGRHVLSIRVPPKSRCHRTG